MRGHRALAAARLPGPPVRSGAGLDRAVRLRREARPPVQLLPNRGRRRRHRRRAADARTRPDHPLRGLLRHLPGPVLRLPSSRHAQRPGARLGVSGQGRERLVPEPDLDRRALAGDRLPAVARLHRQRPPAPRQAGRLAARPAPRGGRAGRRAGRGGQLAPGLLPEDRSRRHRAAPRRRHPVEGADRARRSWATATCTTSRSRRRTS